MNHAHTTAAGKAIHSSMRAKNHHALNARRQLPAVSPSTYRNTTDVQPMQNSARSNQEGMGNA